MRHKVVHDHLGVDDDIVWRSSHSSRLGSVTNNVRR